MSFWGFRPYVTVAERQAKAAKQIQTLRKKGRAVTPIVIEGRKIAKSFWGKAWCDNLERYADFASRLPRGRSYVNSGAVVDLRVWQGGVEALVSGSRLYKVRIDISVAAPARWKAICSDCSGSVGSIVELLQGKLSKHVMERVCRQADGLFPTPQEIKMSCSCPDWAGMCKHVAATLYGVGARLDHDPEMLFVLRGVERSELVSLATHAFVPEAGAKSERVLEDDDVAALFGIELQTSPSGEPAEVVGKSAGKNRSKPKLEPVAAPNRKRATPETGGPKPAEKAAPRSPRSVAQPDRKPSTAQRGKSGPDRSAAQTALKAQSPSRAPKEQSEGGTRAAKWIGAKARKAARK
jgi:uncharacterized Zn finger protein